MLDVKTCHIPDAHDLIEIDMDDLIIVMHDSADAIIDDRAAGRIIYRRQCSILAIGKIVQRGDEHRLLIIPAGSKTLLEMCRNS